jgi:hypothetical protein
MNNAPPNKLLLNWLDKLPQWQRESLIKQYIFMTSTNSSDFAFTDEEAWQYFERLLIKPDFPLRRLAQLLTVRALFSFLLEQSDPSGFLPVPLVEKNDNCHTLDSAQFIRTCQQWRELCQTGLSDHALQAWLFTLQG